MVTSATKAVWSTIRDPCESYRYMDFILRRIADPAIEQTPYGKGPLIVRRSVFPGKVR
jgi:hypothetical protein